MTTWDKEIAKLFKKRDNPSVIGPVIGKVLSSPPGIKVSILSGKVILDKSHIYINESLLSSHIRTFLIDDGLLNFLEESCGMTSLEHDGGDNAESHDHQIKSLEIDTTFDAEGSIQFTNSLAKNDEVLLLPINNNQKFFLICKVKQLE
jgi:hypothetical protein